MSNVIAFALLVSETWLATDRQAGTNTPLGVVYVNLSKVLKTLK